MDGWVGERLGLQYWRAASWGWVLYFECDAEKLVGLRVEHSSLRTVPVVGRSEHPGIGVKQNGATALRTVRCRKEEEGREEGRERVELAPISHSL